MEGSSVIFRRNVDCRGMGYINHVKAYLFFGLLFFLVDNQTIVWRRCFLLESTSSGILDVKFRVFSESMKMVYIFNYSIVF